MDRGWLERMALALALALVASGAVLAADSTPPVTPGNIGMMRYSHVEADGSQVEKTVWFDMDAYLASHGATIIPVAAPALARRSARPPDAKVPRFPLPSPPPDDVGNDVGYVRIHQVVNADWFQTVEYWRELHRAAQSGFERPGAWSQPLVTPHQGTPPTSRACASGAGAADGPTTDGCGA